MRDFTRKLIESLDVVFTILTGGDFLNQYRCECGHGRRWHSRQQPDSDRGACEACTCPCYRSVFPCSRCSHGLDFHRVEEGLDGIPRWTVCIQCMCQRYQTPLPPPPRSMS